MQKTFMQRPQDVQRQWHLVDAKGRVLGEVAAEVAGLLLGKDKPSFTPHVDSGDYVILINATSVEVTGRKEQNKMYYRHTGRPGGLKQENFATLMDRDPKQIFERAVKGMLPKNKQQTPRLRRLKVFTGAEHSYEDKLKQAK